MKYVFTVHIKEQTRKVEVETNHPERYLNGFLDANIHPNSERLTGHLDPQGENSGLDALNCSIEYDLDGTHCDGHR